MDLFGNKIVYEQLALASGKDMRGEKSILRSAVHAIRSSAGGAYDDLKLVRASRKSICFCLWNKNEPTHFAKIHLNPANYEREFLFYTLFSSLPFVPRLHKGCAEENLLILEYLSFPASRETSRDDLTWLFRSIGQIHGTWELIQSEVGLTSFQIIGAKVNAHREYSSISQNKIAAAFLNGRKPNYVPMAIGDLQPAHVVSDQHRRFLIDFDTFSLGVSEAMDVVIALSRFPVDLNDFAQTLILEYSKSRGAFGSLLDLRSVASDLCELAAEVRLLHPKMCSLR